MIILMVGLAYQDGDVTKYEYHSAYAYETVDECVLQAIVTMKQTSDQHAYCALEVFAPETSPRPIARP